jgi:hypothetical protein
LIGQEVRERDGEEAKENAVENLKRVKEAMQKSERVSLEVFREIIPPGGAVVRYVADSGWSFLSCTLISVRNEEGFGISVVFEKGKDEVDKRVEILRGKVTRESILGEILARSDVIVDGLNKYAHERRPLPNADNFYEVLCSGGGYGFGAAMLSIGERVGAFTLDEISNRPLTMIDLLSEAIFKMSKARTEDELKAILDDMKEINASRSFSAQADLRNTDR